MSDELKQCHWMSIETCPLDFERYLFITKTGIQCVDRFKKGVQIPKKIGQHWDEHPNDRYTHWMYLPEPPTSDKL